MSAAESKKDTAPGGSADVVIIGGGPGGSTVGAVLAARGRSVVILEKDRHPRFHIGESLLPQNLAIFERLGILDEVTRIGVHKPGAEFVSDAHGGKTVVFDFRSALDKRYTHSYQVKRAEFDALLFENARRRGAQALEGMEVVDVELGGSAGSRVTARDAAGRVGIWKARYVVDASGRDTFLAKKYGDKRADKRNTTAALFGHFKKVSRRSGEYEGITTVHLHDHGWFWMIPLPDEVMSVGFVAHQDFFKQRKTDLETFFFDTVKACPSVAERMAQAELVLEITATGNYSYRTNAMTGDGYLLVGDAFAFIDPVFSSGVMLAMASAELGAEAIDVWLDDPKRARPLLRRFDRKVRRALDTFSWLIYRFGHPVLRDMFMQPRNSLRMRDGLVSLLAGNVHANVSFWLPVLAFKAAFYYLAIAYKFGFRLHKDGLQKLPLPAK